MRRCWAWESGTRQEVGNLLSAILKRAYRFKEGGPLTVFGRRGRCIPAIIALRVNVRV